MAIRKLIMTHRSISVLFSELATGITSLMQQNDYLNQQNEYLNHSLAEKEQIIQGQMQRIMFLEGQAQENQKVGMR